MVDVNRGVPQEIVLEPKLFNENINDIVECVDKCTSHLFADNTLIYASGPDIHELIITPINDLEFVESTKLLRESVLKDFRVGCLHTLSALTTSYKIY